ncbi:MAG: CRISPR-associated protein Cas4 [Candidatus Margulisiibacteriota bacterium]|nr:MAG: CRISPR-associated protein Cas4 [Candidatus Margulisbacteria bacterium GWD2_39_127]PZM83691.1 MAG: CRISPR-associated protein Cas4 [Candidatus Margulisiibacteriota bacterium]HAR64189.1 CRISPR-associated protein Cas4 [Candidatus Margulisiibacteriota bacterium]HCY36070.1 CRISPR-associated protein Cas4 [Candidatus Margulisiibacteriota bacterium]
MYSEDSTVMLSALQHYQFCPRQCALIHVEQIWEENYLTAQGRVMHERADSEENEKRKDVRIERSIALTSMQMGLRGKADVVEFHFDKQTRKWNPYPVEYKRGKPKVDECDKVQLCAQALCLEEMMSTTIPEGALFYGKTRRREVVYCDEALRNTTIRIAHEVHKLIDNGIVPMAQYEKKCDSCSLVDVCMPKKNIKQVSYYMNKVLKEIVCE